MTINIIIGIAAIAYGVFTLYARVTHRTGFGKLEAMKERWGSTPGTIIHVIAYTVVPIAVGIVLLVRGLSAS